MSKRRPRRRYEAPFKALRVDRVAGNQPHHRKVKHQLLDMPFEDPPVRSTFRH
jgi:hypothetical protein